MQFTKQSFSRRLKNSQHSLKGKKKCNGDLLRRIAMLEMALSQRREENNSSSKYNTISPFEQPPPGFMDAIFDLQKKIKLRRAKPCRTLLRQYLSEIGGMDDIFANGDDCAVHVENFQKNMDILYEKWHPKNPKTRANRPHEMRLADEANLSKNDQLYEFTSNLAHNEAKEETDDRLSVDDRNENLTIDNKASHSEEHNSYHSNEGLRWKNCTLWRAHLDKISSLVYDHQLRTVITAGEDCLIKAWNLSHTPSHQESSPDPEIEPYICYRHHLGPVLSLAYCKRYGVFFSGSTKGPIKCWVLPSPPTFDTYAPDVPGRTRSLLVAEIGDDECGVWCASSHSSENLLACASADGRACLWNFDDIITKISDSSNPTVKIAAPTAVLYRRGSGGTTPTRLCWLLHDRLCVGFTNGCTGIWDSTTLNRIQTLTVSCQKDTPLVMALHGSSQPNQLFTGHLDRCIRIWDLRDGSSVHGIENFSEPVSTLNVQENYLAAGSHDGKMRFFDLRMTNTVMQEMLLHNRKFGEGLTAMSMVLEGNQDGLMITGGADGQIQLLMTAS
eukprot:GHVL01009011.1.p1 GENE.GHVL01009011.1~~GHVL01009011.1.p1  ORF type:complete len:557 (-),score=112.39 GHVL01009011.1:1685-3355(-)